MYNNNKRLQTELYMPLSKIFMNKKSKQTLRINEFVNCHNMAMQAINYYTNIN